MKVVVAGGSGLIGRHLARFLADDGHEVVVLSRSGTAVAGARTVAWQPDRPGAWAQELAGAAALVNLCGENLGSGRWTARRKQDLRESRLVPTRSLVDAVATLPADQRPGVFISISGADVYEGLDSVPATEETAAADSFLARLCLDWEAEAFRAAQSGVRVACLRLGVVLAPGAPALQRLALPFRLFVGGRLGSGEQWFTWVAIDDLVRAVRWAVAEPAVDGVVNVVAPEPLRQRDLAAALGRVLGRPSWLPTPAWGIRLALGEQAVLALGSRRATPARALQLGFVHTRPHIDDALRAALRG